MQICSANTRHFSIIAVHGLGANPEWAWVRKVEVETEPTGEERERGKRVKMDDNVKMVNWLKDEDLLPGRVPQARIMTFNYESKWHRDAPKQRRSLCADQLLSALDNKRKEVKTVELQFLAQAEFNHIIGEKYQISTYNLYWA